MQADSEIRINKGDTAMKKILIILTVMLVGAYELQAQEYVMTVELNNGTKLSLNTNDVKEITFLEGKIVVSGSSLTDRIDSLAQVCSNNYYELSTAIKENHLFIFQERDILAERIKILENRIDSLINANGAIPSNSLIGTVWSYTNADNYLYDLTIISSTVAHFLVKKTTSGKTIENADYTYTYDEATHTGTATYLSGTTSGSGTATFAIDGDKMTFAFDGRNITLTKQ